MERKDTRLITLVAVAPALAVATRATLGITLAVLLLVVLVVSAVAMAFLRRAAAPRAHLPLHILVVGALAAVADLAVTAWLPTIRAELGVYLPLTLAACVALGRRAAPVGDPAATALSALGTSCVVGLSLVVLSAVRELLGTGRISLGGGAPELVTIPGLVRAGPLVILAPAGAFLLVGLSVGVARRLRRTGGPS